MQNQLRIQAIAIAVELRQMGFQVSIANLCFCSEKELGLEIRKILDFAP